MILKSIELNIDLNAKICDGKTAFHGACIESNFEIVDFIIKKSIEFKIYIYGLWIRFFLTPLVERAPDLHTGPLSNDFVVGLSQAVRIYLGPL